MAFAEYRGRMHSRRPRNKSIWTSISPLAIVVLASYGCRKAVADWIDPHTPQDASTTTSQTDPGIFDLVFSDEFNTPGRTFADGSDPRWTALDKNDYTNDALHYYTPKNVRTNDNGELIIVAEAVDTDVIGYDDTKRVRTHVKKHFRSGMLQSWNKFCFTGGIIEAKVEMPGEHDIGGLWPAFWMLGNLARHTYVGSSEHIWPWSSNACSERNFYSQKINNCFNTQHYGMHNKQGRGAPEIDIFEVQPGPTKSGHGPFNETPVGQPFQSASLQVAPGRILKGRPGNGYWPGPGQWYEGLSGNHNDSFINILFYGSYNHFPGDYNPAKQDYWSDAISYNKQLYKTHFNSSHTYRLEWDVPTEDKDGYLKWYIDGELIVYFNGTGIKESGEGAEIPSEPSSIILNTAISSQWGFPSECPEFCPCKNYDCNSKNHDDTCGFSRGFCDMIKKKPEMKIDWIRVYQNADMPEQKVGCSTPERPTRQWITAHAKLYMQEGDMVPLLGIPNGTGVCDPTDKDGQGPGACGGMIHGRCTLGKVCECSSGWTGPHCLSHRAFDAISYDPVDKISDIGFHPPAVLPAVLAITLSILMFLLFVAIAIGRRHTDNIIIDTSFKNKLE